MPQSSSSRNGNQVRHMAHRAPNRNLQEPAEISKIHAIGKPPVNGFTLGSTRSGMPKPFTDRHKILIGLGTQGSDVIDSIARNLTRMLGKFPTSCAYLTMDAADGDANFNPTRHIRYSFNGAGTVAERGRELFQLAYPKILTTLEQLAIALNPNDSMLPTSIGPGEGLDVIVVAGNGGSSGGAQNDFLTLTNQLFIKLRTKCPRIKLYFINHDVALSDPTRKIGNTQYQIVLQTAACNIARQLADFHTNDRRDYHPPGSNSFSMRTSDRVWGTYIMEGSNGNHRITAVEEFNKLLATIILMTEFTRSGISIEDRVMDLEISGELNRSAMSVD